MDATGLVAPSPQEAAAFVSTPPTPAPGTCAPAHASAPPPITLPSKPSALIRVALADLRKVEALPDIYRVNMDVWHRDHRTDAVCEVCLAGSMISQSLGARPGEHRGPEDFDQETTWKLYALNEFRVGNVFDGLCYLDRTDLWLGADTRAITEYTASPAGFHRDMHKLAADLEAVGL
jgi:hypothetical protein